MDVLSDVLRLLRLKASIFFHSSFCGIWSVDASGSGKATFHLIARGACWLHMPGRSEGIALRGGDLVVFPRDAVHSITPNPDRSNLPAHSGVRRSDEAGPSTSLICGYFEFESPLANPILNALPQMIHIRGKDPANASWLDTLLRFISAETETDQLGADVVIDKLSDVLFIQVIRTHIRKRGCEHGLLAALADPRMHRTLQAVHQEPGHRWTVARLAQSAGMSRSAFAKRFQAIMAMAPMAYVTQWRMQQAHERLRDGTQSVAAIAESVGYQTEASFRKAFKQHMGIGPGAVRR